MWTRWRLDSSCNCAEYQGDRRQLHKQSCTLRKGRRTKVRMFESTNMSLFLLLLSVVCSNRVSRRRQVICHISWIMNLGQRSGVVEANETHSMGSACWADNGIVS